MKTSMRILFVTLLVLIGHMSGCIAGYRSAMDRMNNNLSELVQSVRSKNTSAVAPARAAKPAAVSQRASAQNNGTAVNAAGNAQVSIGEPAVPKKTGSSSRLEGQNPSAPTEKAQSVPTAPEEESYTIEIGKTVRVGQEGVRGEYTVISATVYPKKKVTLKVKVKSLAKKDFSTTFKAGSFKLVPKGVSPIEPNERFTYDVPPTPEGIMEETIGFTLPDELPELTKVRVSIENFGTIRYVDADLTRPGSTAK